MIKINFSQILNSMKNKNKIVIIVLIVLLIFSIYQAFFKKDKDGFDFTEVTRGTITQEISETGKIQKGEEINLNFKNSGKIEKIYVKIGDNVSANQDLAKLDTSQLYIQLKEAEANFNIIKAQKSDAQISLEDAQDKLEDATATADETIKEVYKGATIALDDAYLKTYNASTFVNFLRLTYFNKSDDYSVTVLNDKIRIEAIVAGIKPYIDDARSSLKEEDINLALSRVGDELSTVKEILTEIRGIIETPVYRDLVLSTDKSILDTHKLNINTVYANITSAQQDISLTKINNKTNIDTAQSNVSSLENKLKQSGAGLYQAQLSQVEAQIALLENQINDATLKTPVEGQIIKVNKREGELVQPTSQDALITILPKVSFELETNIYEEDVIKMEIGNPVEISLIAIPDKVFNGKVAVIDPSEELVEGVVYYKVTIVFDEELPQGAKPGMTADVKIITSEIKNVLTVPQEAIQEKNGNKIVQVFKNGKTEDRDITTGLEGSDDLIEIISGLQEGEKIIIQNK